MHDFHKMSKSVQIMFLSINGGSITFISTQNEILFHI